MSAGRQRLRVQALPAAALSGLLVAAVVAGKAPAQDLSATSPPPATAPSTGSPPAEAPQPASPPAPAPPVAGEAKPPPPAAPAAPQNVTPIASNVATTVLGRKVEDAAGKDMGAVVDVVVDKDGTPRAAIIDFGGFLGVGSRKVAIDWHLLQFRPDQKDTPIILGLNRAEVQAAPEYKPGVAPVQVVAPPPAEAPPAPPPAEPPPAPTEPK